MCVHLRKQTQRHKTPGCNLQRTPGLTQLAETYQKASLERLQQQRTRASTEILTQPCWKATTLDSERQHAADMN
eukprot:1856801-Amphidinium_carterae.1